MVLQQFPVEILGLIYAHLDVRSFLNLSATCKALHSLRFDAPYWSSKTQSTFRLPNRPATDLDDGERWHKLYRRLLTQTDVYTWGKSQMNNLGRKVAPDDGFPKPMDHAKEAGVISDLQCGGWSTSLLSSKGAIYVTGVLNEQNARYRRPLAMRGRVMHHHGLQARAADKGFRHLDYPVGFVNPAERYEPATAIRQFSSGRSHLMGLSDIGIIWSWYSELQPAVRLKFLHVTTNDHNDLYVPSQNLTDAVPRGTVQKVIAGWGESSAYIAGTGIVVWDIVSRQLGYNAESVSHDTQLVPHAGVIPWTNFKRSSKTSVLPEDTAAEMGAVVNYTMLEGYVVFITDLGRVYASSISRGDEDSADIDVSNPFELSYLRSHSPHPKVDIQGSFRTFGIFLDGKIIIQQQSDVDRVRNIPSPINESPSTTTELPLISSLQNTGVIQLAFGDYHFHALHSDGTITSHGKAPQGHATLGLGGSQHGEPLCSFLRGAPPETLPGDDDDDNNRFPLSVRDRILLSEAETLGRRVWFDQARQRWLKEMTLKERDEDDASERMAQWRGEREMQVAVSNHIEERALAFASKYCGHGNEVKDEDDGLGPAFALSVAAAGWHSGALVLVNEGLMERMQEGSEKSSELRWGFPKLKLADGREMSGSVPLDA